jgi:hypothetical protein
VGTNHLAEARSAMLQARAELEDYQRYSQETSPEKFQVLFIAVQKTTDEYTHTMEQLIDDKYGSVIPRLDTLSPNIAGLIGLASLLLGASATAIV